MLSGSGPALICAVETPWKTDTAVRATGSGPLGRGARGYIPLHLTYEAHDLRLTPGQPIAWHMTLKVETER